MFATKARVEVDDEASKESERSRRKARVLIWRRRERRG
jgi:hypothetical protein